MLEENEETRPDRCAVIHLISSHRNAANTEASDAPVLTAAIVTMPAWTSAITLQKVRMLGGSGVVAMLGRGSSVTGPVSTSRTASPRQSPTGYQNPPAVPGPVWAAIDGPTR